MKKKYILWFYKWELSAELEKCKFTRAWHQFCFGDSKIWQQRDSACHNRLGDSKIIQRSETQSATIIEPNMTWEWHGTARHEDTLLFVRGANENVWHILVSTIHKPPKILNAIPAIFCCTKRMLILQEVHLSTPAEWIGVKPCTNCLIGSDSVLHESEDLFSLMEVHASRAFKVYTWGTNENRISQRQNKFSLMKFVSPATRVQI